MATKKEEEKKVKQVTKNEKKTTLKKEVAKNESVKKEETKKEVVKNSDTVKKNTVKKEVKKQNGEKDSIKKIKVTYVKSVIGYNKHQAKILEALGFRKLNQSRFLPDNASIRGSLNLVRHLVKVEEVK